MSQIFTRAAWVEQAASTSSALRDAVAADPDAWPHLSVLAAHHQTAGRGRAGRSWDTPPGVALTASVLVRPAVPTVRLPWLTQLAGLAVVRALRDWSPERAADVGLKWPNDVLVDGARPALPDWGTARKVGGILTELLPAAPGGPAAAVVVGIGVNLTQGADALPVPSATSLALAGMSVPEPEELLDAVGRELRELLTRWERYDGAPRESGLLAAVSEACRTLGRAVRVDRPAGPPLFGTAEALDDDGCLVLRDHAGQVHRVLAGDVLHVRADGGSADDDH